MLAIASGKQVKLFDNDLKETATLPLDNNSTAVSLSTDGERLAVQTDKEGELVLIDIKKEIPLVTNLSLGEKFNYFTLADKNTLFVSYKDSGEVSKISLTAEPTVIN